MIGQIVAVGLMALGLTGCAYQQYRDPQSNRVVTCGQLPIWAWHSLESSAQELYKEAACFNMVEAQNYHRVAGQPYFFYFKNPTPLF